MIGIEEYLQDVADDFCAFLEERHQLCDLKRLHFDQGLFPDYSETHIQQLYLLRYAYSYAFEYYVIFKRLISIYSSIHSSIRDRLRISSIGCGNGMDYWALVNALEDTGLRNCSVDYRGNDIVEWNYRIDPRENDIVNFLQKDIKEYLDVVRHFNSDVYIFPKSISEFDDTTFRSILNAFQFKKIETEEIGLIVSMRSNEENLRYDMGRVDGVKWAIVANGFEVVFDTNEERLACDTYIARIDGRFIYPDKALRQTIPMINTRCSHYLQFGENCSDECGPRLTRKPILKTSFIRYRIVIFRRRL